MSLVDAMSENDFLWIDDQMDIPNVYGDFRWRILCGSGDRIRIAVCADSDYRLWFNGRELGGGQFTDYPEDRTYRIYDVVQVHDGENLLALQCYHAGADFSSNIKGKPGVLAVVECNGQGMKCCPKVRRNPAYQSGNQARVSPQLGFVFCFDARKEDDWKTLDYDDSQWGDPISTGRTGVDRARKSLKQRPIAPLREDDFHPGVEIARYPLRRYVELDTYAHTVMGDSLLRDSFPSDSATSAYRIRNGECVIFDLGAESVGFLEFEVEAPSGTVLDLAHGEHLDDGKVRAAIHGRNFCDRYICRGGGREHFCHFFRRLGLRYLEVHITYASGPVRLNLMGIRPVRYPLPPAVPFECGEVRAERLRELGLRTLDLCMHDHYEDCPWREQSLYAYDSRNQMRFGYYAWGNYEFAAASLDLLGRGIGDDGQLNLCAPTHRSLVIPIFSFVWVSALWEHYEFSGDRSLLDRFSDQIEFMVEKAMERYVESEGLFHTGSESYRWHFYEWVDDLSSTGCPPDEFHALFNLYLLEMLYSAGRVFRMTGKESLSDELSVFTERLGRTIEQRFYDSDTQCYASFINGTGAIRHCHEHTQVMMLAFGLVPDGRIRPLIDRIRSRELVRVSFSPLLYVVDGLFRGTPEARRLALELIDDAMYPMLDAGATSLWEVCNGGEAFDKAGSLCHAWSAVHVYFYGAKTLGVRPLEPGFRRFEVKPYPGNFPQAEGSVPTPAGPIRISWKRNAEGVVELVVVSPPGLDFVVESYPEYPVRLMEGCSLTTIEYSK